MMQAEQRLEWKFYFANMALGAALRSTCPKAQVGAVLIKDREVISTGYNGAPKGMKHCIGELACIMDKSGHCIRSVHAEANAIIKARNTKVTELFCTHMPCIECCKLIMNAEVKKIYYIFDYYDERSADLGYQSQIEFLKEGKIGVERIDVVDLPAVPIIP